VNTVLVTPRERPAIRAVDYLTINLYWLALSYLWNSLGRIVLPVLISSLVAPEVESTSLGILTSVGLIIAVVVQPVAGALSDRSTFRWGPRRPYLLVGTIGQLIALAGIILAPSYAALFLSYSLLQFLSNVAHGPYQGLIPDRVPPERWGTASGVKQFFEISALIVTSLVTAKLVGQSQTDLALVIMMGLLLGTMLITMFTVHEEPLSLDEVPSGSVLSTVLRTFQIDVRRYADYVWLLVSRLFILVGVNLISNFALYFIRDVIVPGAPDPERAATELTGVLLALIAVAILVLSYPAGYISDRLGRKPLVVLSGLLGMLGSFLLCFAHGRTLLTLSGFAVSDVLAFGSVLGLSLGLFLSADWAWATDLVPDDEAGRYLGISNLATAGAGVVSGFLGGPLIDVFNARQPNQGYLALFAAAFACFLLGTIVLRRVRDVRRAQLASVALSSENP
jgi:MFS family permease